MYGRTSHPIVEKFLFLVETDAEVRLLPLLAVAKRLGVSLSHLQHLVREGLGLTCTQLIRAKRVERIIAEILENPQHTLSEIAYRSGYEPRTMRRHFKSVNAAAPSAVREQGKSNRRK